jgi:hypothetical protein
VSFNTFVRAHQCPLCELRFASRSELVDHLVCDHPEPPDQDTTDRSTTDQTTTTAAPAKRS